MEPEDLPWPGELEEEEEEVQEEEEAAAAAETEEAANLDEVVVVEEVEEEVVPELDSDFNFEDQLRESTNDWEEGEDEEDEEAKAWLQAHPGRILPPPPPPRHRYSEGERASLEKVSGAEEKAIPDKSEDTEWFSRPSEVREALFQATSEVASDLTVNSCFSVSQHPLVGGIGVDSQRSFLPPEQGTSETISSDTVNETKTPKDSDSFDGLYLWKTQKDVQQPESNLGDKHQSSVSTSSDISDENITGKRNDSFDASCSYGEYEKQEALQQAETYLTSKDYDFFSDSSDTIDKNKMSKGTNNFSVPFSSTSWSTQETSHDSEAPLTRKDHVSFPHEVASHHNNKTSYSFPRCLLERREKGVPLVSDSRSNSVYLRAPSENGVKKEMDSLEGNERNESLQEEIPQYFEQNKTRNNSEVHLRSSEIQYVGNVIVPDNSVKVSEAHILSGRHDTSKMEAFDGPLPTVKSNLDETSEQLYFQEERTQKATSIFGEKNVHATENVAFEAVIASIEPSGKESTVNEIQTDIHKSLTDDNQERESKNRDLSPLNYSDENSFFDKLKHPNYQSTPGVFEPAASKSLLYKKDDDDSSLYWFPNLKSPPNGPQEMPFKPLSVILEFKSSASLNEKSYNQAFGKIQSTVFQCDIHNEPFLPNGKIKSVSALDLAEKVGSSNIFYPVKVSTSDSLVLQDLKQHTFEEFADSSDYNLEGLQGKAELDVITDDDTECCSLDRNAVVCSESVAELQGETCDQYDLTGDTSKGGIAEITQSSLKLGTITTPRDSDIGSHPSLHLEDLPQLAISSPQENTTEQYPDTLRQKALTDSHLTGETLKVSAIPEPADQKTAISVVPSSYYSQRGKPDAFYQQSLPVSHFGEETLKVSLVPGSADQKTGVPTVTSTPYSQRETPGIFYQQTVAGSHIPEEALRVLPVSADQKTGIATVTSTPYSQRERPDIFYQQTVPGSRIPEEALKVSAAPGPADPKTGVPTVTSTPYSQRETPGIFYQQAVPGSHIPEEALRVLPVSGTADQKTGIATVTSTSYSQRERPDIFYQQTVPGSRIPEEALKVSAAPGPADPKTGVPTVTSTPYSQRETPGIFYQQTVAGSHIPEEALRVLPVSGTADQKTGIATVTSTSYSQRERPDIFYQQTVPGSRIPEEALKVSAAPGPADPKTGVPTVTSTPYSQRERPDILYQQTVPGSRIPEEGLVVPAAPGPADQKTGVPTVTPTPYSPRGKPGILYQKAVPDSHIPEEALRVLRVSGTADQKTGIATVTSIPYSQRERPDIFYQQTVPGSHIPEEGLVVSAAPGPADQKTGVPTVTSTSYSPRGKPGVFYQQAVPDSHIPEEALKVLATSELVDQKTGVPTVLSTPYSPRGKPGVFYQQAVPDSHIPEEALRVLPVSGTADQKTGIATVTSTPYSQRERPDILYQQTVPGSRIPEEALEILTASGLVDQKTGVPTVTSTPYSPRGKSGIFYQQAVPGSHPIDEVLKVSAAPGLADSKTGVPTVTSTPYSPRGKPGVFYQQAVPGSHPIDAALKGSAVPGPADPKTRVPTVTSTPYSPREKPGVFYEQAVADNHIPEEALKVSFAPGPAEQKTDIPAVTSSPYSQKEKPDIFYQQAVPGRHIPEEALTVSAVSGLADQKTGIPTVASTSYSHRDKPGIFYQQELPESYLTEEALKGSDAFEPTEQKTGITTVSPSSYSHGQKPLIFYQQALPKQLIDQTLNVSATPVPTGQKTGTAITPSISYSQRDTSNVFYQKELRDTHLTEETLEVSAAPAPADQKTGILTVLSNYYSQRKKPGTLYQQELTESHLTEETLKVSAVPGSADQKTKIPTVPSSYYSPRENPSVYYEYEEVIPYSYVPEEDLIVSAAPGPADPKTEVPTITSTPYSPRGKPGIFYQQTVAGSHIPEETLRVLPVSGTVDKKTGIATVTSTPYSQRERPDIFYQQAVPGSHIPEEALKVSVAPGPTDQKTGIPTVTSTPYSPRGKPGIFYQQAVPGSHPIDAALKGSAVPGPADPKTRVPTVTSTPYSPREKPGVFYEQAVADNHIPEEALKVSFAPGPAEQKTDIPAVTSSPYSQKEKPDIFYQQAVPGRHIPEEALTVSAVSGLADQKTGIPTVASTSYSHRDKPGIFYQQELPESYLTEEALKGSDAFDPTEQKTGITTVSPSSYSHGQKPLIFYQQALPKQLIDQTLNVSATPVPTGQKTGTAITPSISYSQRDTSNVFYQKELRDTHLTEETLEVSAAPAPADQKTGILTVLSNYYSQRKKPGHFLPAGCARGKPGIFYQQELPEGYLAEEALNVSGAPGPADQKTGITTVTSTSYSQREKPGTFYQQTVPGSYVPEETLKVSAISGPANQKTGVSTVTSTSYAQREKPEIFYQEVLPGNHIPKEALKVSGSLGPAEQKIGTQTVSPASSSLGEESIVFYSQTLPDNHLLEEALTISGVSGPADQVTGIAAVSSSSYSLGEKPIIFHQQPLPGSAFTKEPPKVLAASRLADQEIRIPIVPPTSYSPGEKPIVFYQQALPDSHLLEEVQKASVVPGPADQKARIPTATSASYPQREKPIIAYQQEFLDLTEEALKVSSVPEPGDQKTGIRILPSVPYLSREQSIISYQQESPDLTEIALKAVYVPRPADQKTATQIASSRSPSQREKPIVTYQQELPNITEEALDVFVFPGPGEKKTGIPAVPLSYYSYGEKPSVFPQQELPDGRLTEEALKVSAVSVPAEQKTETGSSSSYLHREKPSDFYQQILPDSHLTEEALRASTVLGLAGLKNKIPTVPSSSYSQREKLKISTVGIPDDQKTELPTVTHSSYLQREKPKISTVIGPDDHKTPLLTVFRSSYSKKVKPGILFKQQLPGRDQSEDVLKISTVPEPTDVNTGIPVPLSSSYLPREESNVFYQQELPDRHLNEDVLKVSEIPGLADQKTELPTTSPSSFSHREKSDTFYEKDLSDKHPTEDALKVSSGLGRADQIIELPAVPPSTYSHGEKQKLVSEHVQRLIDNLNSSDSSVSSNGIPLNSRADDRVVISEPEPSGFGNIGCEEIQNLGNNSKTLKEIRTLLMEAENIALKRCNFPAPLVPFRDVSDISFIQSKKVVCFKEPSATDISNGDLLQRQPFIEESSSNRCVQKDIGTQTNLKCQGGIENWQFFSSTTVRSPLQKAESRAGVVLDETLRQYEAAKYVMRSEPEGCSGTIGNKIIIPMMTIIKSDSSSDASDVHGSYSWDSNLPESLESVSDVLLNFFPYASPKTSIADSREEEGVSDSEDGGGSSVDSLAAHVKNLLKCESSLNHAKQILRDAEEEECRVRARAWNLKFNLAHECGYSISELNEDDRRKVEEIKAKLFSHGRTDLSKGLQSPQGIGCTPEAVCSHIIIESHEKGCFRTLTAEQPQPDSHPCASRPAEPSAMIRGQQSPSSWRARHINFSKSLDQNNPHFKVWNSLQLQSHSPFQNLMSDDFKISKGLRMPFHEKMDPWLSELVEPPCVPPDEVDFHSSSQMSPPEPMKKFTTSITFSSHRHSKCISDSSVLKVGVNEGSQYTGASVGVFNSHVTEEQNPPRDLKQEASSPSSFKKLSHSPDKKMTILAEGSKTLPVDFEHSHQEEKLLERSDFKVSHSEPNTSTNYSNFKEVQFSDNCAPISMSRPSSTLGVKTKNVTVTPDLPSHIFLEKQELFEQSKVPHADHHVRKHHSPLPHHQDCVAPHLCSCFIFKQRELIEQCKVPYVDFHMRECHSLPPQGQDYIASDLPSPIFLKPQSKVPGIDDHMRKHNFPFPQGQDCIVEKNNQHKLKSHISNITVEAKFDNVISQSAPNQCTLETSASTPPSNRKALSCVRITLCPKTPSKLDSGILDKRLHSLDPATKTRMNSEFNSDLQTLSSRSLEPTSKLLTSKPIAQDQESLGFIGLKSSLDFQVVQSPLPDSNNITQDLKTLPSQNSQIVTSRQIQVNISDLEGYSIPEGTPVSADRSPEKIKTPLSAPPGKLSSDAVTQITTEGPEKTMFSSEIFVNAEDHGHGTLEPSSQKLPKVPVKFASASSVQQMTPPRGTSAQPLLVPYKPPGSTSMYYVPQLKQVPSAPESKSDTTIESSHSAQPLLVPYKPPGSTSMYYVPQLKQVPSAPESKSDTTIESSHSGSNDAIAPDFPAQVLGTRDDDLSATVNIKHKEGIYSKRAMIKPSSLLGKKPFQEDYPGSNDVIISDAPGQVPISRDEDLSKKNQKEEIIGKKAVTKVAQPEEMGPLQKDTTVMLLLQSIQLAHKTQRLKIYQTLKALNRKRRSIMQDKFQAMSDQIIGRIDDMSSGIDDLEKNIAHLTTQTRVVELEESECHSEFENTTHSVFKSAKFYFHHPVHLPNDQDVCHESLGRSVFVRHSWRDFFQHHQEKHTCLPPPYQNVDQTTTDYTRVKSLSINVNLGNKEVMHTTKSQARDFLKSSRQGNESKRDHKVTPETATQHTTSLNELWNRYQERQKQQKPREFSDRKELSLVDRLDRLAKLLQNPITHSLQASESTHDDSRGERDVKEWGGRQQLQKNKFQRKKRYKSLERNYKSIGDLKKSKVLPTQKAGRSNQIKIEQIKFDKYILRKHPGFNYISNTSSDSRPSEESELFTDTPTNILSTTTSPVESDILTQTDKEVALHERSSSISTIDTARLIQAFGHERVCLSPRRIKLYSSITDQQRRYLEKRSKHTKKALNLGHPLMTSEHTRRRHIQVASHMDSSDSVASSASSFLSSNSTLCIKHKVHMLNKGVQAGKLEIVNGAKRHTRDVGMTFPTPSSSEARLEEDSDVTSWTEEKIEEKILFTSYPGDKKLKKNKQNSCEGVSWFVPVENVKSGSKKENLPKIFGPGISWFEPITKTKPWREPLREQNQQAQPVDSQGSLAGLDRDGRGPLRPFVRATLQESLKLHRPDFISRSGERIKRLKLIVQERKLQNMLQSERDALFNTARDWQGSQNPMSPLPKRVFLTVQKNKPIGKKEMIQRSKRIYEQLPEVQKKKAEEKRRSEYKSYRLRAQLYKKVQDVEVEPLPQS
ncbi:Alstrom syndrome protein 1 [Tupaia chinensis]|uniref:Alstrom syndrome protein 1 n=1 Tax=Tupaia chinensis TaxID=246437 RepID=L9KM57_TUPCH|nr:Alstrom syndrome protein 1 [Tupaia chinensis]